MLSLNLDRFRAVIERFKPRPTDVVGLDIGRSGVKAVRLRNANGSISFVAADILPPVSLPDTPGVASEGIAPMELPRELAGRYASITVSGMSSIVKLLSFPGHADAADGENMEAKVIESIGVKDPDNYRVGYKVLARGHGKSESRALAVAVPEVQAQAACMLLPTGLPVPYSIEISGLSAMTAFLHGPASAQSDEAIAMVEFGARASFFAIFLRKTPVLIRKFDFGSDLILEKVQQSLGVDRTTAEGILSDGSFDVSQQIGDAMDGFIKQAIVSRDFVERRENCRVGRLYASGGVTASRDWLLEVKSAFGFDVDRWNPFEILKVEENAFPDRLKGQETRFSAAIGAGLATLVEEEEEE